jgi:eukaryotic-like serine/threonine-protein kinase
MNLRSGTRLGPYEIVAPIGAGGMGEVYKATDTRLGRTVAIKFLPTEFGSDTKLRLRFEREAKVISSLSHPNICGLFDVGENYLVMEHCEGQTLAERLSQGPLPLSRVLEYGIQIAEALERAHRNGIIHRDLKPSNIIVTKDGVKLIDFGLARHQSPNFAAEPSPTTTLQKPVTEEGTIAGTVQYMAPETLTHGTVDVRSDVFALGLVLYEMASGKPAFREDSRARLIAAILEREAPSLGVNAQFDRLVADCLRKDPDDRWQSAGDAARQLRWLLTAPDSDRTGRGRRTAAAAVLVAAVVLSVGAMLLYRPAPQPENQKRVLSLVVNESPLALRGGRSPFALAPDGRSMVYAAGNPQRLFHRSFDSTEARVLPDTEGAGQPFFSPDGKWIGYLHQAKMKKVSVSGGDAAVILQGGGADRPVWGENGKILFGRARALFEVSADGGEPREILRPTEGDLYERPSLLPGGNAFLFTTGARWLDPRARNVALYDRSSGRTTVLVKGGSDPRYSPTGHLVFARTGESRERSGTIYSVPLDISSQRVTGDPQPLVTGVEGFPGNGSVYWSMGAGGDIYYVPRDHAALQRELVWLDSGGNVTARVDRVGRFADFVLSPDRKRIAYSDFSNIWVGDLERETWIQLPSIGWFVQQCIWSPDGSLIAYQNATESRPSIAVVRSDGSAPPEILAYTDGQARPTSWSPDAKEIAFDNGGGRLFVVDVSTRRVSPLAAPRGAYTPSFSPDGRWLAYMTIDDRDHELIHVQSHPDRQQHLILHDGPACPPTSSCANNLARWSDDSRGLYFLDGRRILKVEFDGRSGKVSNARVVFESPFEFSSWFNVSADGRRFLVERYRETPRWNQINVVSGWSTK